jgi:hypothetical protein
LNYSSTKATSDIKPLTSYKTLLHLVEKIYKCIS